MTDDLMSRLADLDPVPTAPEVPPAAEMRRRVSTRSRRSFGRPRLIPTIAAGLMTAGAVAAISTATGGSDSSPAPKATAPTQNEGGRTLAEDLAGTNPVNVSATRLDGSIIEVLATGGYGVNVSRAWKMPIPGDARPAWLFAGDRRLALVVPRALRAQDGTVRGGAVSTYGASIAEARTEGIVGTQSGAGQDRRVIVLLPRGAETPSIVRTGTSDVVRSLEQEGRIFIGQPGDGEEVFIPSQPAGRDRISGS